MEASSSDSVTLEKLYEIQQASIKETDQISFKLLGLVPLVNGVALLTAILGSSNEDVSNLWMCYPHGAIEFSA